MKINSHFQKEDMCVHVHPRTHTDREGGERGKGTCWNYRTSKHCPGGISPSRVQRDTDAQSLILTCWESNWHKLFQICACLVFLLCMHLLSILFWKNLDYLEAILEEWLNGVQVWPTHYKTPKNKKSKVSTELIHNPTKARSKIPRKKF